MWEEREKREVEESEVGIILRQNVKKKKKEGYEGEKEKGGTK